MAYIANIVRAAAENANFRTVLHTGAKSQLVVMNVPPGEDIGEGLDEAEDTVDENVDLGDDAEDQGD